MEDNENQQTPAELQTPARKTSGSVIGTVPGMVIDPNDNLFSTGIKWDAEQPPDKEAVSKDRACARRLSIEQWLLELAEQQVQPASIAHLQRSDPEEWARQFDAWVDCHRPGTPVLSEEAMSRESIYPDCD